MLQQRIVVEQINLPRTLPQTLLKIRNHASQAGLRKRIKEKQQSGFGGKRKLSRISADRFDREALLRLAVILVEILLSGLIQSGQELHADDAAKGIVRGQQQRSSLARA